jgi:glycosyltransferase involved in cell wall biosynthesis
MISASGDTGAKAFTDSQSEVVMLPNRIKLLKFVTLLGYRNGGTENHAMNLVQALDPSRFDMHLACLRRWGHLPKEIEARQIPLVQYEVNRLYGPRALKQQLRFARYIRHSQIEIVNTYGFYANVFAIPAARLAGVRVIIASIQDIGAYLTPTKKRLQKLICRWADCIVANAEAVRQWLIAEGYNPAKITVIRTCTDLSKFANKTSGTGLRQELGLPPLSPLVAVLSRLDRVKGIEYFLEAAAMVARRVPEARFLVVGDATKQVDGDYRKELERRADRLGLGARIRFTGLRHDVPDILAEVAVSVLPSLSEGLSNVLLESMAAGVPVVATTVGGNPEAIEDGVTGLLVPPRDPGALAQAICRLLDSPELASRFGQAGRERVIERFSLERMVQETESLYLDLLNRAGHRIDPHTREAWSHKFVQHKAAR